MAASTVWAAFRDFRRDYVDLDGDEVAKARTNRDFAQTQLKGLPAKAAEKGKEFPVLSPVSDKFVGFGSFSRRTKCRPLDDIDFLMLLNGTSTSDDSGVGLYQRRLRLTDDTSPLAPFANARSYYGETRYVNSTRILNAVKSSLELVSQYRSAAQPF